MDPTRWPHAPNALALVLRESGRRRMKIIAGLLIAAALAVASGCAKTDWIDRTLVTVDVTGSWYGIMSGSGVGVTGDVWLELTQRGSVVEGSLRLKDSGRTADVSSPIEGTVGGDVFRFKDKRGAVEGEMTVNGDELLGRISTPSGERPLSLRRVGSSSPPASPPR